MLKKSLIYSMVTLMLFLMFGCASRSQWNDGKYQGSAEGLHGEIVLSVVIENGRINGITIDSQNDTAGVSDVAFEQVPQSIIENQSTDVDAVAGATVSSEGVIAAVESALSQAMK